MSHQTPPLGKPEGANRGGERPAELTRGDLFRRVLAVLLPMMVLATAVASTFNIYTIFATYPACCVLGFLLAFSTMILRSRITFLFAISAPLAVAICCMAIAIGGWGPDAAQLRASLLWWTLAMIHLGLAIGGNQQIWSWRGGERRAAPLRWQFRIRSLLLLMAMLPVVLMVCREFGNQFKGFAYFSAGILLMVGALFSLFTFNLPTRESESADNPWETPGEPSAEPIQS